MGWNAAYTIFEETVIGAYDLGKLDKELLAVLMEPYRGTDTDSGGRRDLLTKDGKEIAEVTIEAFGLELPPRPAGARPEWHASMTPEQEAAWAPWEEYDDKIYELMGQVTDFFGWH